MTTALHSLSFLLWGSELKPFSKTIWDRFCQNDSRPWEFSPWILLSLTYFSCAQPAKIMVEKRDD